MNIGIDIDDTLVDTTKDLEKDVLKYDEGKEVIEHLEEIMRGEIPTENIRRFLNKYLLERIKELKVKTNAKRVIKALKKDGHNIIFITSRGEESCKGTVKKTTEYLNERDIPYDKIIFSASDKAKACKENNIELMIDDSIKHCEEVDNIGIRTFLFNSIVNKGKETKIQRIDNWKELEEKIKCILQDKEYISIYDSPIGKIKIEAEDNIIIKVELIQDCKIKEKPNVATVECKKQLEEYFIKKRKVFDLKYRLQGTEFECKVWRELEKIPYGKTLAYKDISEKIGNKKAVRGVANAIGKNKLLLIIPCHRVIGSNGKLVGFSAKTKEKTGLEIKKELLDLEEG